MADEKFNARMDAETRRIAQVILAGIAIQHMVTDYLSTQPRLDARLAPGTAKILAITLSRDPFIEFMQRCAAAAEADPTKPTGAAVADRFLAKLLAECCLGIHRMLEAKPEATRDIERMRVSLATVLKAVRGLF